MLERERLESKKISKTNAVTSQLGLRCCRTNIHVGPSDYVPWLEDRKWCYIRMEGTTFGNVPLNCELKLEVWDSPNSAGVVIDAIRCAKLALDRGIGGALDGPLELFHEDAAAAVHGRRGPRAGGSFHPRRTRWDAEARGTANAEVEPAESLQQKNVEDPHATMIEAIKLWNEPNNLSHWDFQMDPKWSKFAEMVQAGGAAMPPKRPDCRWCWAGSRRLTRVSFRSSKATAC